MVHCTTLNCIISLDPEKVRLLARSWMSPCRWEGRPSNILHFWDNYK